MLLKDIIMEKLLHRYVWRDKVIIKSLSYSLRLFFSSQCKIDMNIYIYIILWNKKIK